MKVLITGGAGFLGRRLAKRLLQKGVLKNAEGEEERIDQLVLFDAVPVLGFSDPRVRVVQGDVADAATVGTVIDAETASIFHLAAVVSSQSEDDFDLGMRVNLDATQVLFETCRSVGHCPKVVFASSLAVYGGNLPEVVHDDTALNPKTSYGVQKAICELLLADYSRKGFIDGRGLRLPTISVRPGKPNKAASGFFSGIIREPLAGIEAVLPVDDSVRHWVASPASATGFLIHAATMDTAPLGARRCLTMPGLSVTVGEMIAALGEVAGQDKVALIRREPDATIRGIVAGWPRNFDAARATAAGFVADASFQDIIRAHIRDMEAAG